MSDNTDLEARQDWKRLIDAHHRYLESSAAYRAASKKFLSHQPHRVALLHDALRGPDRVTALVLLSELPASELEELFGDLLFLASFSHGAIRAVRDVILSLPRDWIREHIEQDAEPLLANGTDEEYRRLLELYSLIDRDLALRLARRAANHADPEVLEVGTDFLERLTSRAGPSDGP